MTTNIAVTSNAYQVEKRSWLIPQPGSVGPGYTPSGTLLPSLFTAGTHYPNGFIPSGTVLGRVTASGYLGPFDPAATDGRQTAVGLLFSSVGVNAAVPTQPVGGAFVAAFAVVRTAKLPFQSGVGSLTAAARTALATIYFE
jgi:hypothetical protein